MELLKTDLFTEPPPPLKKKENQKKGSPPIFPQGGVGTEAQMKAPLRLVEILKLMTENN